MHERIAEDKFAAHELTDSEDFDNRQKARNILRYQLRQYCFELPPTCAHWGKMCFTCPHVKCRENENYDKEQYYDEVTDDYDFDPDIDRFASLFENLQGLSTVSYKSLLDGTTSEPVAIPPQSIDTERSMGSLLSALAERAKTTPLVR
jgi:hypothetical protein